MSEENVAILKRGIARFLAEGVPNLEMFDPGVEIVNFDSFPVTGRYRGWDGVAAWLEEVSEAFDDFRFEPVDVLAHDSEHVVTTCRATGESKTGGPSSELVWGVVWTFRNGKVIRSEGLRTAEEALEAAGLSE